MKKKYKSKSGFTLIELLVVIGILAVLASIAIPAVAGLINRANVSADTTNADEMTRAIERFTSEYELFCQDIASDRVDIDNLDSAQGRVYHSLGIDDRFGMEKVESDSGFYGVKIDRDTKYPDNYYTVRKVIKNYMKTNSSTFEPKQSDMHYWYSPDCGIVVFGEPSASASDLNKKVLSGKDAKGNTLSDSTRWIDITGRDFVIFGITYRSEMLYNESAGYYLVMEYTFFNDGAANSSTIIYNNDKKTVSKTMSNSYSVGMFDYLEGKIENNREEFAIVKDGGDTLIQRGTVYGDVTFSVP